MNGADLDKLARSLAAGGRTRRTLLAGLFVVGAAGHMAPNAVAKHGKKPKKITICSNGQTLKVRKKGWQSNYPGATVGACPPDVCAGCPDTCYATLITPPDNIEGYACCPAELVCKSTSTLPDQCCYPGETCDPTLIARFPVDADTNCCRPCKNSPTGGCCVNSSFECDPDTETCVPSGTARLPRTRRPV